MDDDVVGSSSQKGIREFIPCNLYRTFIGHPERDNEKVISGKWATQIDLVFNELYLDMTIPVRFNHDFLLLRAKNGVPCY